MVLRAILHRAEETAAQVRDFTALNYAKLTRLLDKLQYLSDSYDIRVEDYLEPGTNGVKNEDDEVAIVRKKNPYVTLFNSLRCAPDITDGVRYNAKHKSNIMALWRYYKRSYGLDHDKAADPRVTCYTNNVRLGRFIQHMTKWQVVVAEQVPLSVFEGSSCAFLLNPDVKTINGYTYEITGVRVSRSAELVVLSSIHTINKYFACRYVDKNVISPNNTLGKGKIVS